MQKEEIVYYNGEFMPFNDVKISPDDRGFLFADGVYEVIRSYHSKIFMLNDHLERLQYSLNALKIQFDNFVEIPHIIKRLIELNSCQNIDCTIYIQISRGVYKRMLKFPDEKILPTVYMKINPVHVDNDALVNGIKVYTVDDIRWGRCDVKTISLIANVLSHQQAIEKGGKLGLFVKDGKITEGTHTGVFGVKNGKMITHPDSNELLGSITRKVVYRLCEQLKIEIIETPITISNLYELDELFVVGTTPEITGVVMVDDKVIGDGMPGIITKKLQSEFLKLI